MKNNIIIIILLIFIIISIFLNIITHFKVLDKDGMINYDKELSKIIKNKMNHGELISCTYSNSGDMNGNINSISLKKENNKYILETNYTPRHDIPLNIVEYNVEEKDLNELIDYINKYNLPSWSKLPVDNDLIALDAPTESISISYDDSKYNKSEYEVYTINFNIKVSSTGYNILKEFINKLNNLKKEKNIIREYKESEGDYQKE